MTLLNTYTTLGGNRQPEKGILPSGGKPVAQSTCHRETTRLRGRAAKRSGTICSGERLIAQQRTRLIAGSSGNQPRPWLDPQRTKGSSHAGALSRESAALGFSTTGRASVDPLVCGSA